MDERSSPRPATSSRAEERSVRGAHGSSASARPPGRRRASSAAGSRGASLRTIFALGLAFALVAVAVVRVWHARDANVVVATLAVLLALVALAALVHERDAKKHFRALYASENARRLAEERNRTILMRVGDGVIATDAEGSIESLNPAAEALTGWRTEQARGRPIEEVFRIADDASGAPRRDSLRDTIGGRRTAAAAGATELIARDGSVRPIADTGASIRDEDGRLSGAVFVLRDQSQERASERALVAERRNLDALMMSSPVALVMVDGDSRVVQANPAASRMLGGPREPLAGQRLGDILRCPNRLREPGGCGASVACHGCEARALVFAASRGDARARECELEVPAPAGTNGASRTVRLSAQALLGDGAPRTVLALWDVTEQKRAIEAHERLEQQLAEAMRLDSIGRLAGGVAHDFNNLMTIILTNVAMVLEDLGAHHASRSDLLDVQQAGERAATLTRQLLAFGRKQLLRPRPLRLDAVLQAVEPLLRSAVGEAIELRFELGALDHFVNADPVQIERVVMNLAVNARDAMPDGGQLTIRTMELPVAAAGPSHPRIAAGAYVSLSVVDTGSGMDEATRARIFEPFFTTKELGQGTGLGLATVYGIVAQSGGSISVDSAPGRGTRFEVLLPIAQPTAPSDAPPASGLEHQAARGKVLVVEDQPQVRRAVNRILLGAGFEVSSAASGDEAMRLCDRAACPFDVLLTDVMMPGMGGAELAERVLERCPRVGLVFMSGYPDAPEKRGPRLREARFVAKPFKPGEIVEAVRSVMPEPSARPAERAGFVAPATACLPSRAT